MIVCRKDERANQTMAGTNSFKEEAIYFKEE